MCQYNEGWSRANSRNVMYLKWTSDSKQSGDDIFRISWSVMKTSADAHDGCNVTDHRNEIYKYLKEVGP